MKRIISLLIENETGSLSRIAGLFSARGYNIESLTVAPTDDDSLSRMTIVTFGDDAIIEQITKQLNKLINVVKLVDLTEKQHIESELLMVKVVAFGNDARAEITRLTDIFRGRVIDVTDTTYTLEMTGSGSKVDIFLHTLSSYEILEVVRSGVLSIGRGKRALKI